MPLLPFWFVKEPENTPNAWIKTNKNEFQKSCMGEKWQLSLSISEKKNIVIEYIKAQREHHKT